MNTFGLVLLLLGAPAMLYGGLSGPASRTTGAAAFVMPAGQAHGGIPASSVAGGIAFIAGAVLLALPRKRDA